MRRDIFNAIADPTRRSILQTLINKPQNLNALAEKFEITRQAVSLHVKYLHECGAISIKKVGRERYCDVELKKLSEISEWIEPFRIMWSEKLSKLDNLLTEIQEKSNKGNYE